MTGYLAKSQMFSRIAVSASENQSSAESRKDRFRRAKTYVKAGLRGVDYLIHNDPDLLKEGDKCVLLDIIDAIPEMRTTLTDARAYLTDIVSLLEEGERHGRTDSPELKDFCAKLGLYCLQRAQPDGCW